MFKFVLVMHWHVIIMTVVCLPHCPQVSEEVAKSIIVVLKDIAAASVEPGDTAPPVQQKVMSVVADNCSVMTNALIRVKVEFPGILVLHCIVHLVNLLAKLLFRAPAASAPASAVPKPAARTSSRSAAAAPPVVPAVAGPSAPPVAPAEDEQSVYEEFMQAELTALLDGCVPANAEVVEAAGVGGVGDGEGGGGGSGGGGSGAGGAAAIVAPSAATKFTALDDTAELLAPHRAHDMASTLVNFFNGASSIIKAAHEERRMARSTPVAEIEKVALTRFLTHHTAFQSLLRCRLTMGEVSPVAPSQSGIGTGNFHCVLFSHPPTSALWPGRSRVPGRAGHMPRGLEKEIEGHCGRGARGGGGRVF